MSMPSWPTSLLNASNRRLREEIESKTAALAALQHSCSESRGVVRLLRENVAELEKEKRAVSKTVTEMEQSLHQQTTELKQFVNQVDAALRQRKQKEEEYARLGAMKVHLTDTLQQKRAVLQQQVHESKELEEVAKVVIEYSLSRQREGEALEAAKAKLSSSVWQKLDRLHAEIAKLEHELEASREEQEAAFRELAVVQERLHEALRDHQENVGSLEKVHHAYRNLDVAIAACGAKMAAMQATKNTYSQIQNELTQSLTNRLAEHQKLEHARDRARMEYDKRTLHLRNTVTSLQAQAVEINALRHRYRAEDQHLHAQSSSAQLVEARWQEAHAALAQQQQYYSLLSATIGSIQRELVQHPVPSAEAIQSLFDTLDRQRSRVEDRLERMQTKLAAAVQEFVDVGQSTEAMSQAITDRQAALRLASQEVAAHQLVARELREVASSMDVDIASARAGLPALLAKQAEMSRQHQTELEAQIASLREDLHQHQVRHRELLQETTTLRSQHMHAQRRVSEEDSACRAVLEQAAHTERDLAAVTAESSAVGQRHRAAEVAAERTGITLRALMQAADAQLEAVKESAGLDDLLRAQVVAEEEKIDAERQGSLLELHLQQNALHEHTDEWQRCVRQRDLIRQRYEETMAALTRAMEAPLRTAEATVDEAMLPSTLRAGAMGVGDTALTTPEALHARLILRRSYEREQLMRRGNALDLQLLGLERETAALRRTLDTLRVECQKRPVAALGALKRRSRSVTHFGADRTNRPPAPRVASTHAQKGVGQRSTVGSGVAATSSSVSPFPLSPAARTQVVLAEDLEARSRALRAEVAVESEAVAALNRCRADSKRQLENVKRALQEAKVAERQKQAQLQRLRDDVRRENLKAIHSVK